MCSAPLGDVNGDGLTDQVSGNVIRVQHPTVTLLVGSNQAALEGGTLQPIVELTSYNQFGQGGLENGPPRAMSRRTSTTPRTTPTATART